jgi:hypothetical protein
MDRIFGSDCIIRKMEENKISLTIANNIINEYATKKDYSTVGLTGRRKKNDTCLVLLFII